MSNDIIEVAADSTRGGFFLVTGTAFATLIMAIASILIARFLGPELYGQYTLVIVAPQLLLLFTDLGINQGIIKYTASLRQQHETKRIIKIIKYGALLRTTVGIIIFVVTYFLSDTLAAMLLQRVELSIYVKMASASLIFHVLFTTATSAFVGLDKTEYNALTMNAQASIKAIVSTVLVILGFGVAGAIIGYVASYVIAAVAGLLLLLILLNGFKGNKIKNGRNDINELKILIWYGAPLYISVLLQGLIPSYQSIILAYFATDADVGNYKAAANFITLMAILTVPITTALLPAFSKLNSTTNQKIKHFFKLANKYTTLIIIPTAFLIMILSNDIVQIVYGSTFQSAPEILATYCLLYFLTGLGYLTLASLFNGIGDTKTTLKISLAIFLTVITLTPVLTQSYKVQGLIISFIIANMIGTIYGTFIGIKRMLISFDSNSLVKIYLCSILSAIPVALIFQLTNLPRLINVVVGGLLYVFTYLTLIPLTKTVTVTEIKKVTLIIQRTKMLSYVAKPLLKYQLKILKTLSHR